MCATRGVHTLLWHAHFSALCCAHLHIFMRAHSRMARVSEKVCCMCMSCLSISPSPFSCFTCHPCCLLTVTSRPFQTLTSTTFLPSCTRPNSAGQGHFRKSTEEFGYFWPSPVSTHLKPLGLTESWIDDVGGPEASQISELRGTAKWHDPPEGVREEDDLLTGQELKLIV